MIKVYNTLTGRKEAFTPVEEGVLKLYSCGATVQGEPHIGHMRAAITADIIRRTMALNGYRVISVYNFTDIDDKLIIKSSQTGEDYRKIAADNIDKYMKFMKRMNIMPFTYYPHATKHIEEIIALISDLIDKGYAYESRGDVYFRVGNYAQYGQLSKKKTADLISGKRIEVNDAKENPLDFTLWKKHEDGEPFWYAPFGRGRPGWHIECSAMSMKYLGETFDIHTGGEDLIFPHHENEIAQSCASTGQTFAHYWMHNGMINLKGEKMSKSIGNVFTIEQLLGKYEPDVIRMYLYKTHYRKGIEFSIERLDEARNAFARIMNVVYESNEGNVIDRYYNAFREKLNDDINTPEALSVVYEIVNEINADGNTDDRNITILRIMRDMGFSMHFESSTASDELMDIIIELRNRARSSKDFDTSDYIRDRLSDMGITLKDTKEGTVWRK